MNIRATVGAVALAAAGLLSAPAHAAAACSDTFDLGPMGPPGFTLLSNGFARGEPSHFDDCYNFTLNNAADSLGLTWEWDLSFTRDIDLASVSLSGGSLASPEIRPAAGLFSFSDLLAGAYQLVISGDITRWGPWDDYGIVGYTGALATTRSAKVPEPQTAALVALGLAVVGWSARRGKRKA